MSYPGISCGFVKCFEIIVNDRNGVVQSHERGRIRIHSLKQARTASRNFEKYQSLYYQVFRVTIFIFPKKLAYPHLREIASVLEILHALNYFLQIKLVGDTFETGGTCGKCLFWRFASAITWGNFFIHGKTSAHLIDSGTWLPVLGANLTDAIFPHIVYGFRGINLPIATYHVSKFFFAQLQKN